MFQAKGAKRDPRAEYALDYILERKSVQDLLSSIKEERYERQKYYLKRCGLKQLYYLVEGDPDTLPGEIDQKRVRSATARTEVIDGFTLLRSSGHLDTFRLFHTLTQRIQALYGGLVGAAQQPPAAGTLPTFAAWQAGCKENAEGTTTLHDVWGMMLGALPSLGPDAVQAILQHYPTPLHLHRAYKEAAAAAERCGEDGQRAAERLLHGLKSKGGTKSIGPDKAAKIYRCLFQRRRGAAGSAGGASRSGGLG